MNGPYRIVRFNRETGVTTRSKVYYPDMPSHAQVANTAATRSTTPPPSSSDALLDRRIDATLARKTQPMPSSLAKRMDEACATNMRQLKRVTFPDEPTFTTWNEPTATGTSASITRDSGSRATRFQSAFVKPAENTTITAEPTATVTSSTVPSRCNRFQPATTKPAESTTSTVGPSTTRSRITRGPPTITKSAENTTSSVGSSTTHSRNTRFQRPIVESAENTTVTTTTTSSESRSSHSVSPQRSSLKPLPLQSSQLPALCQRET